MSMCSVPLRPLLIDRTHLDGEAHVVLVLDLDPEAVHELDGHVHVGGRHQLVRDLDRHVALAQRRRHQERREVLWMHSGVKVGKERGVRRTPAWVRSLKHAWWERTDLAGNLARDAHRPTGKARRLDRHLPVINKYREMVSKWAK